MRRGLFAIIDALAAGDAQRVAFDFDVEVRLAHAGHLDDRDDIVALAEDVDRGIGAAGAQPRPEPTAGPERIDCPLEFPELFERIEQRWHDLILLSEMSCTPSRRRDERIRFKFRLLSIKPGRRAGHELPVSDFPSGTSAMRGNLLEGDR